MTTPPASGSQRFRAMFALIVAGELIFSLPFHLPRYFRASVLEAFGFSNAQLGDIFAVYGLTAMLAYFPGGAIADRWPARRLMSASLLATAMGGLYLATAPGVTGMSLLYGYWGVTTILLFWAAMIRATRRWGGMLAQGRAFGLLDGGRGLVAAACASLAVACFQALAGGTGSAPLLPEARQSGLHAVVLYYSALTAGAGLLVWRWVPKDDDATTPLARHTDSSGLRAVIGLRAVWLQAFVVVCAYCGYKGLDNYALYAVEVLGLGETEAARFTANCAYLRPFAAIAAGLVADRLGAARAVVVLFALLALVYLALALLDAATGLRGVVLACLLVSYGGVFALRGVYFALLQASGIPFAHTGAAVGLISLVGYTPDVFFAPLTGRLLDSAPGLAGHQRYFIALTVIAIIGLAAITALTGHRAGRPLPAGARQ